MMRFDLLPIVFVLSCLGASTAKSAARGSHPPEAIYVGDISIAPSSGGLPLLDLAEFVAKHPHTRRFRVDWNEALGSYSEVGTALFDRRRATMEYFRKGDHNAGYGLTGVYLRRTAVREHSLFTRVSPAILTRAGTTTLSANGADVAFHALRRYGCGQKRLLYRRVWFSSATGRTGSPR